MRATGKKACAVLIAVLIMLCGLSGCVKMAVGLDIKPDGSGDVSFEMGVTKEAYSMLTSEGQDPFAEVKQQAADNGYTAEEFEADGYKGIKMRQGVANLEAAFASDPYMNGLTFKKEKRGLKQMMSLNGTVGSAQSLKESMGDVPLDASQFDMKLTVSVPYPITSSNAEQISEDNKTATWDLVSAERIELVCEGDAMLFGMPVTAALCIVGGLALIAVVLIVVGAVRKKKAHSEQDGGGSDAL